MTLVELQISRCTSVCSEPRAVAEVPLGLMVPCFLRFSKGWIARTRNGWGQGLPSCLPHQTHNPHGDHDPWQGAVRDTHPILVQAQGGPTALHCYPSFAPSPLMLTPCAPLVHEQSPKARRSFRTDLPSPAAEPLPHPSRHTQISRRWGVFLGKSLYCWGTWGQVLEGAATW